jgi:hypothetical protein
VEELDERVFGNEKQERLSGNSLSFAAEKLCCSFQEASFECNAQK